MHQLISQFSEHNFHSFSDDEEHNIINILKKEMSQTILFILAENKQG